MAQEENRFSIDDVLDRLSTKLVNRHPHVFGDVTAETSADVLRNWEALKAQEKDKKKRLGAAGDMLSSAENQESLLAGVSSAMPALLEAHKLSSRAAGIGFDWPDIGGLFEKLSEETRELQAELRLIPTPLRASGDGVAGSGKPQVPEELRHKLEEEVGDLFFVLVNLARYLSLDSESALKSTNRKFRRRFQWIEEQLRASGLAPQDASMEELESLWQRAKKQEQESAPFAHNQ